MNKYCCLIRKGVGGVVANMSREVATGEFRKTTNMESPVFLSSTTITSHLRLCDIAVDDDDNTLCIVHHDPAQLIKYL